MAGNLYSTSSHFIFSPMKRWIVLVSAVFFVLLGCGTSKEVADNHEKAPYAQLEEGVDGRITNAYVLQGCPYLFEYKDENDHTIIVRPLDLDSRFQKDGLHVRMVFRPSRASNGGCDLAHPVIVEGIEEILPR